MAKLAQDLKKRFLHLIHTIKSCKTTTGNNLYFLSNRIIYEGFSCVNFNKLPFVLLK